MKVRQKKQTVISKMRNKVYVASRDSQTIKWFNNRNVLVHSTVLSSAFGEIS